MASCKAPSVSSQCIAKSKHFSSHFIQAKNILSLSSFSSLGFTFFDWFSAVSSWDRFRLLPFSSRSSGRSSTVTTNAANESSIMAIIPLRFSSAARFSISLLMNSWRFPSWRISVALSYFSFPSLWVHQINIFPCDAPQFYQLTTRRLSHLCILLLLRFTSWLKDFLDFNSEVV